MTAKKTKGKTNWDMLRQKRRSAALPSAQELEATRKSWADADIVIPGGKTRMTVRFDTDIVEWFKSSGSKYQTRMNMVLRQFMNRQSGEMLAPSDQKFHVSESSNLPSSVSTTEYVRALNRLGEIAMLKNNFNDAAKYFEMVVRLCAQQRESRTLTKKSK